MERATTAPSGLTVRTCGPQRCTTTWRRPATVARLHAHGAPNHASRSGAESRTRFTPVQYDHPPSPGAPPGTGPRCRSAGLRSPTRGRSRSQPCAMIPSAPHMSDLPMGSNRMIFPEGAQLERAAEAPRGSDRPTTSAGSVTVPSRLPPVPPCSFISLPMNRWRSTRWWGTATGRTTPARALSERTGMGQAENPSLTSSWSDVVAAPTCATWRHGDSVRFTRPIALITCQ